MALTVGVTHSDDDRDVLVGARAGRERTRLESPVRIPLARALRRSGAVVSPLRLVRILPIMANRNDSVWTEESLAQHRVELGS